MNDTMNEPFGFKVLLTGFATWITSMLQGFDVTQVLGFVAVVLGLFIQIVSYFRNKKADQREKEADARARDADNRAKAQYDLQMQVLASELRESQERIRNGAATK